MSIYEVSINISHNFFLLFFCKDYYLAHVLDGVSCRTVKTSRDAYVKRLNGIYENNLIKDSVEYIPGHAKFIGPKEVTVGGRKLTAQHILIATGTKPMVPKGTPGNL